MAKNKVADSGQIFKNPFLEAMTKTHIAIPLVIFYGTGVGVLVWSILIAGIAVHTGIIMFLAGFLGFTLVEYLVHKNFYHLEASTPRKKRIQYVFHGVHHDHPRDKKRLALPPVMSVLLAVVFISIFRLIMGMNGYAFGAGFMTGYATYLLVHYAIHVYNPPKNILGSVWKHHNLHHFADPEGGFGVSSPLWDHVFGTMPRIHSAKK